MHQSPKSPPQSRSWRRSLPNGRFAKHRRKNAFPNSSLTYDAVLFRINAALFRFQYRTMEDMTHRPGVRSTRLQITMGYRRSLHLLSLRFRIGIHVLQRRSTLTLPSFVPQDIVPRIFQM
eukprot:CCRYP_004188-RA/>CCRYP_004188-RA protein AED:0.41 eAED:0.69 QI:201/0/0.5/1/0/0/2/0/119